MYERILGHCLDTMRGSKEIVSIMYERILEHYLGNISEDPRTLFR